MNATAISHLTLNKIRKMYSKVDNKAIAKQVGIILLFIILFFDNWDLVTLVMVLTVFVYYLIALYIFVAGGGRKQWISIISLAQYYKQLCLVNVYNMLFYTSNVLLYQTLHGLKGGADCKKLKT